MIVATFGAGQVAPKGHPRDMGGSSATVPATAGEAEVASTTLLSDKVPRATRSAPIDLVRLWMKWRQFSLGCPFGR